MTTGMALSYDARAGAKTGGPDAVMYLPFVRKIVMQMARRLPSHIRLEDLMSAAMVGLLEALERFDSGRYTSFENFAEFRIKGALLDELRRRDLMARDARIEIKKIEQAVTLLTNLLGREPSEEEIARHLHLQVTELRTRLERLLPVHVLSIEDLKANNLASTFADPYDSTAKNELLEQLATAIGRLQKRHQQVLQLYYQEDLTLREIGEVLAISESRVCQILSEATIKLRVYMHANEAASDLAKSKGAYHG